MMMTETASMSGDAFAETNVSATWEDVELAESYLVCGMFEEAKALASSVLVLVCDNENVDGVCDEAMYEMKESAAMVLVQSLGESGRVAELLNELKAYFGDVSTIPPRVVLIGASILVATGFTAAAREFLEDVLGKWQFKERKCSLAINLGTDCSSVREPGLPGMEVDEYLEVVEFYSVTLLGKILSGLDHAVFWVEKAKLPEQARQDLLRKLHSLLSHNTSSSSQVSVKSPLVDDTRSDIVSTKEVSDAGKSEMAKGSNFRTEFAEKEKLALKRQLKLGKILDIFSWFPSASIRFGNVWMPSSTGVILLCGLILIVGHGLQKKRGAIIMRLAKKRALSLKQAMIDVWRLAFSYQVNPLAAVQAVPGPPSRIG
ncbi:APEM9-like protein [Drosera capensis]